MKLIIDEISNFKSNAQIEKFIDHIRFFENSFVI